MKATKIKQHQCPTKAALKHTHMFFEISKNARMWTAKRFKLLDRDFCYGLLLW